MPSTTNRCRSLSVRPRPNERAPEPPKAASCTTRSPGRALAEVRGGSLRSSVADASTSLHGQHCDG